MRNQLKKIQQQQQPLKQRLEDTQQLKIETLRRSKASSQIGKFVRNNTKFKIARKQTAFKDNVISLTIKPAATGSAISTDIIAFIGRSYLLARKQIPRNSTFQIWASCEFEFYDYDKGELVKVNPVTTKKYTITPTNGELAKFFNDLNERISQNYGEIQLKYYEISI